jgi:uncharacterized protein (DUF58 family)
LDICPFGSFLELGIWFLDLSPMKPLWLFLYRSYRIFSGLRYWVLRRFTRPGLVMLGAMFATAMMGPDTDNNVAYQAFTLLFFLLAIAFVFSWFFRVRFSATRLLPRFGTVGQPFRYAILVKNLTAKTQRGLTLLDDLADPRLSFKEWYAARCADEKHLRPFRVGQRPRTRPLKPATVKEAPVPPIPPGQEMEVPIELMPLRRGVLRFAGATLARPDPIGLFRAMAKTSLPQSALILPRRYPLPAIALPGTLEYQAGGVALASSVGQSEEFVSLRDYRQGDPLRHIHWRSWARVGKPVVKEFEDEFFVRHALVLDTFSDHPHSEAFEEAVSVAASFACAIQTQESLLDLLFVGPQSYCFTAGRGLAHADQMLEILASVRPCPHQRFSMLEELVLNHLGDVSGCVCILMKWDDERRSFIQKLKAFGTPVLVVIITTPGKNQVLDPGPMSDEPDRFHVLELGQIEQGLAKLQ